MDSKHQSISHTISARMREAINTTTELCANSLREGQLTLCTNSVYDSLMFSTSFIYSRFYISLLRNQLGIEITFFHTKSGRHRRQLEAMFVTELRLCSQRRSSVELARKAGIEPTLTVLETALLPLEDFRKELGLDTRAFTIYLLNRY